MKKYMLTIIIFVIAGLIISSIIYFSLNQSLNDKFEMQFLSESNDRFNIIKNAVNQNSNILILLESFFLSSKHITKDEFFYFTQNSFDSMFGVARLEYAPKIQFEEKDSFYNQAKIDGLVNFQIYDIVNDSKIPASERDFYYPVYYIVPFEEINICIGIDVNSNIYEPNLIQKAIENNVSVISAPLKLFCETSDTLSYSTILNIEDTEDLLIQIVNFKDLFNTSLVSFENQYIDVFLFDTTDENNIQYILHYYDSLYPTEDYKINLETMEIGEPIYTTENIYFSNRKWTLVFFPTEYFTQINKNYYAFSVLILLLIIVFSASFYYYLILKYNNKLESLISKKTKELEELTIRDPLTGIYNRRKLFEEIPSYFNRYDRLNENFSLSMIDLDLFKEINDKYGHDVGDFVLQSFSKFMAEAIRDNDLFIRYGGEEFVILFENADKFTAKEILDRILEDLNKKPHIIRGNNIFISFSAGIADITETQDIYMFIKIADERMYKAKENGRNQIFI